MRHPIAIVVITAFLTLAIMYIVNTPFSRSKSHYVVREYAEVHSSGKMLVLDVQGSRLDNRFYKACERLSNHYQVVILNCNTVVGEEASWE